MKTLLPTTVRARALHTAPASLPLDPLDAPAEDAQFAQRCSDLSAFFSQPRFEGIKRSYSASDVASKQGSIPPLPLPASLLSDKLYKLLDKASAEKRPIHTMGAIDPVQMTQMAKHQEVVYVSGWACSSVLTTASNEVGPDLA